MKDKEGVFLVAVPHMKGGGGVGLLWRIILLGKIRSTKQLDYAIFDYRLFEEDEGGEVLEGIYGYSYLKHIVELWPGDWV